MNKNIVLFFLCSLFVSCGLNNSSGTGERTNPNISDTKTNGQLCSELEEGSLEQCILDGEELKDNLTTKDDENMKINNNKEIANDFNQKALPVDGDLIAEMKTTNGTIMIKLFKEEVPSVVNNFVGLASEGYYDGIIFHRVINNFMIQGGDPTGTGMGGKSIYGEKFNDEFSPNISNIAGSISMANSGPDTNGSQFFINQVDNVNLDYNKQPFTSKHAVFGQVYEGFENVEKIAKQKVGGADKPVKDIKIISLKVYSYNSGKLEAYTPDIEKIKTDYSEMIKKENELMKSKKISVGDVVEIDYVGKFDDGKVFDTSKSEGRAPLSFEVGIGQVIKGMDNGVVGLMIGDKKTLVIKPEDAYGVYDEAGIKDVDKKDLQPFVDNGLILKPGEMIFTAQGRFLIHEVNGDNVKVDFNHELAGKTLTFDIEIIDIKK